MEKQYMIGFDVGGTKTDAVLFDNSGAVLAREIDRGMVPSETGIAAAEAHYIRLIRRLTDRFAVKISALYGSVATADYFGNELEDSMKTKLTDIGKVRIEEDGPCLISGEIGHRDGCSIICGTGSSLYIRQGDEYHHTGGGGYLIDSCGSGYVLGRMALKAAYRAQDKRAEQTILCEMIEKQCGETLWEHYLEIYRLGRPHIASFANTVFEARNLGDPVAIHIFNFCAAELADLVWVAYRELGKPFDLVYNGGIFYNYREYAEAVRAMSPGCINSIFSDVKPIYGCAVEAMHDIGMTCDETFKKNFTESYDAVCRLK